MSEATYDDYREGQYAAGSGYEGPPVPFGGYFPPEFAFPVGQIGVQAPIGIPAPPIFPTVRIVPRPAETGDSASEASGDSALPEADEVIDPELRPVWTVYEGGGPEVAPRTRETDWDWVYEQWVILNAPEAPEVDVPFHDNIDWGTIAGNVIGGIFDPFGAGAAVQTAFAPPGVVPSMTTVPQMGGPITAGAVMPAANGCPPYGPKYAKICLATNVITPLRRRRRRRLLTSSDIKDLAALKAIVGGAALQGAVVQAIRR